jgi:DNA-binding SARP family transcriptional activator/tetratricopeptide (TPR) repeat protein
MQFGLLGPLVLADTTGRPIEVPGARLRVLLAMLLIHANRPVSADLLAETMWNGAPPPAAARTLRSHVARLRRLLGAEAQRLAMRDPGYLIFVEPAELDVAVFDGLCRSAGTALRARQWADAADAATRALELWRGEPLMDVPSPTLLEQTVPRLEQLRLQALEDRAQAELHLGGHERLIPQLRSLTVDHPLRERFHAQLMLALARAGRQAETLAAYRHARRVLVDELGIEPGPELRRLHERVLAGDTDLLGPAAPPPSQSAPPTARPSAVPRQLPAAARHFIGRESELDVLTGLLGETGRSAETAGTVVISAIDGMAGIGKTALAVHAAHRLAGKFPDGQLFIDLHGYTHGYAPRTPGEALDWFLRALEIPPRRIPRDIEERAAFYRQRLADTRTLIVLDNAADEAQVRPLLPGSAGCLVLITSRRRLKGLDDAFALSLDVLPHGDAITLLTAVAGPERVRPGDPVAAEIVELCGCLPLAVRIAGALLRHRRTWSPQHLAGLLRDLSQRLATLADGERDLGTVFDLSYHSLSDAQRGLFRSLGLVPGPDFDAHAVAALTGTDPATATRLLEDLVDHSLLISHSLGRYRLHDLIRAHAHTRAAADHPADRETAMNRLLDYYQHTAARADAFIARHARTAPAGPVPAQAPALPDPESARTWLRTERANLLSALRRAAYTAIDKRVIALTSGLSSLLRTDGPWAQAIALHTAAATAAERLGDRSGRAGALIELGSVRRLTGDCPGAARDLGTALELYRDTGDQHGQAVALFELGVARSLSGDHAGAAQDLAAALDLHRDLGDRRGQGAALIELAVTRRMAGDFATAARDLEAALELHRELSDQRGQAVVLLELAVVRRATGDFPTAARHLEAALDLHRDLDDRPGQAAAMTLLGDVRLAAGDCAGAAQHLEAAVGIFRELGQRGNEAWALNHYAAVLATTGDYIRALDIYRDVLHMAQETRQPDEQAISLEGIAECHLHTGETADGTTHLKQALEIFQRLGMKPDASRVRTRLARLAL